MSACVIAGRSPQQRSRALGFLPHARYHGVSTRAHLGNGCFSLLARPGSRCSALNVRSADFTICFFPRPRSSSLCFSQYCCYGLPGLRPGCCCLQLCSESALLRLCQARLQGDGYIASALVLPRFMAGTNIPGAVINALGMTQGVFLAMYLVILSRSALQWETVRGTCLQLMTRTVHLQRFQLSSSGSQLILTCLHLGLSHSHERHLVLIRLRQHTLIEA